MHHSGTHHRLLKVWRWTGAELCLEAVQEMEKVLQNLEFLTMSEPLEAEEAAASP